MNRFDTLKYLGAIRDLEAMKYSHQQAIVQLRKEYNQKFNLWQYTPEKYYQYPSETVFPGKMSEAISGVMSRNTGTAGVLFLGIVLAVFGRLILASNDWSSYDDGEFWRKAFSFVMIVGLLMFVITFIMIFSMTKNLYENGSPEYIRITNDNKIIDKRNAQEKEKVDKYNQTEPEHIAREDYGGMYADNEILVVADSDAKEKDIQKLAEKYDAEIVGGIEATGDYQWLLSDIHSRDDLDSLVKEIADEECIESACLNFVYDVSVWSSDVRYGAEWENAEWSSVNVGGKNWNLEAIHAMEAWEYLDKDNAVRVGLIDGGFDASNAAECCVTPSGSIKGHDDLAFAATFYNDVAALTKDGDRFINHGTHVAGIMAAISDNDEGICGVYPFGKGNLYGASFKNVDDQDYITGMGEKCTYAELILRNVKVINCSYGGYGGLGMYSAAWQAELYDDDIAKNLVESANLQADNLAKFFERLINKGYDFVIIQGSGNASNFKVLRLKYDYKTDEFVIDNNGNVTHDINGVPWFVNKKDNKFYVDLQDGQERGINNFDESQIKTAGFVNSIYSIPAAINKEKYPDVYNRIIVVGSFGFHDTIVEQGTNQVYFTEQSISGFSNLGTRVDILAPGEKIFSTIYSGSKYDFMGGTSMAAPHVSGVAAMVWTANNQLTGEKVKRIICENTNYIYKFDGQVAGRKYGILNAEKAVKSTLGEWYEEEDGKNVLVVVLDDEEPENGGIIGYVADSIDSAVKINGATVTAIDENGKEYTALTDLEGHFELVLPVGKYTIRITKENYKENNLSDTYTIKLETVITLQDKVLLQPDPLVLYKDVLDMFYNNISTNWKQYKGTQGMAGLINNTDLQTVSYEWYEQGWSISEGTDLAKIGYQFVDIDQDGVDELAVGSISDYDGSSYLIELYTIYNNQIIHLASSTTRDSFSLCTDNSISEYGSGGAAYGETTYYRIENGVLSAFEAYKYDGWEDENNPYFYSASPSLITGEGYQYYEFKNWKHISKNEYQNNDHKALKLRFTPFSEYQITPKTDSTANLLSTSEYSIK